MPLNLNFVNSKGNQQHYALDGTCYTFSKGHGTQTMKKPLSPEIVPIVSIQESWTFPETAQKVGQGFLLPTLS